LALAFWWWEATSLLVIPEFMRIGLVIAYRWSQIMKEQAEGTFSLIPAWIGTVETVDRHSNVSPPVRKLR